MSTTPRMVQVLRYCSSCKKYWRLYYRLHFTCPCPACFHETEPGDHPLVLHFGDESTGDQISKGPALCKAGRKYQGAEHDQNVTGVLEHVTCKNCRRIADKIIRDRGEERVGV